MLDQVVERTVAAIVRAIRPIVDETRRARLQRLDPWKEGNRSAVEQTEFKTKLLKFYECSAPEASPEKPMAKCMVSDGVFPQPVVIASHIWKYSTRGIGLDEFGLTLADLDSWRNGLLLASEIEKAFDKKRVAFSYNLLEDKFTFHVLDRSLLDKPIIDTHDKKTASALKAYVLPAGAAAVNPESDTPRADPLVATDDASAATSCAAPTPQGPAAEADETTYPKFRDFDNKEMTWSPPAMPFRRLLAWHYAIATITAQRRSWFRPEHPLPVCCSDGSLSAHSPDAKWPADDVLDLFDHAVSKSERDASDEADAD